jgi:uncharacterized protein YutE (UPF0331/DUF86 family)
MDETIYEYSPERIAEATPGKAEIASASTPEDVIRIMRRKLDLLNRPVLVEKAMEMESEVVQEVVRRLKTNLNTGFIETSLQFLARSTMDVSEEIIGYFDEMRSPYAQSMALVLLGFKADEKAHPLVYRKTQCAKKDVPT